MERKEYEIQSVKYVVGELIGNGGTSDVVQASTESGLEVALKIYRLFQVSEAVAMSDKISKEAEMMMEWKSPWIVKGLGFLLPKGAISNAVLAMELMKKGPVENRIAELSPHQIVMAIISATLALDFMHSREVVHGDVKPSNLLLDGNYHAKLSDFGASRNPDGNTMTSLMSGFTTAYAALEVLSEETQTIKSDIYSLGLLLRSWCLSNCVSRSARTPARRWSCRG
jgi:serine/threonine-protein kinase